jgi:hypothetical protein
MAEIDWPIPESFLATQYPPNKKRKWLEYEVGQISLNFFQVFDVFLASLKTTYPQTQYCHCHLSRQSI